MSNTALIAIVVGAVFVVAILACVSVTYAKTRHHDTDRRMVGSFNNPSYGISAGPPMMNGIYEDPTATGAFGTAGATEDAYNKVDMYNSSV